MPNSFTRQRVINENLLDYARINRDDGFLNDFIILAGNKTIPANRLVLSCLSKYFEKLLRSLLRYDNIIEIEAVDGSSMETLVDYMYSGSITINNQNVMGLLSGADYLDLDEVKQFCFEFLLSNVRPDNSFVVLKAATQFRNQALTDAMQQYISANLDEVAMSDDFKTLAKDDLISYICIFHRFQANNKFVYKSVVTWTRHNEERRKCEFLELFKILNLDDLPVEYLENVVLETDLVLQNSDCLTLAYNTFQNLQKAEKSKLKTSHIISLGGAVTGENVGAVFSLPDKNCQNYANFEIGLNCHCSLILDNHIYSIGGLVKGLLYSVATSKVLKIDFVHENAKWENVASMNEKRYMMGASEFEGTIFVAGGADEKGYEIASSEFYVPSIDAWKSASSLNQQKSGHALVSCVGVLYAVGGWSDGKCLSSAERLATLRGAWQNIQQMQAPRRWFAAVNCDGVVYAIGGVSDKDNCLVLKTVEKYDSAANQWNYVSEMSIARYSHAACVMRGKIYVVGGKNAEGKAVKAIECYDPADDTWSIVRSVIDELWQHTLVVV